MTTAAVQRCNSSHKVVFAPLWRLQQEALRADLCVITGSADPTPADAIAPTHLTRSCARFAHMTLEPPTHLPYRRLVGFHTIITFRQEPDSIWLPFVPLPVIYGFGRALRYEPQRRRGVGVWVDNCARHRDAFRLPVLKSLINSGLAVRSYGKCLNNVPDGTTYRLTSMTSTVKELCRSHRLMLAIENNACEGYITGRLPLAMGTCGAIPIVKQRDGLPRYSAIGGFPYIDAGRDGWLEQVRRVLEDDDYYRAFLDGAAPLATRAHRKKSDSTQRSGTLRRQPRAEARDGQVASAERRFEERQQKARREQGASPQRLQRRGSAGTDVTPPGCARLEVGSLDETSMLQRPEKVVSLPPKVLGAHDEAVTCPRRVSSSNWLGGL